MTTYRSVRTDSPLQSGVSPERTAGAETPQVGERWRVRLTDREVGRLLTSRDVADDQLRKAASELRKRSEYLRSVGRLKQAAAVSSLADEWDAELEPLEAGGSPR